ncbi:MAG: diaminopimelate epimerase [Coriobacteriales bacterium]|nr:diaminopimelate epimerase [Coriobacteriales bacterium]
MHFTKMHGLGNDYLYVYGQVPDDIESLSIRLSNRHTGAGSDGMIYIGPSDVADFSMRIFNADGSEAMMCGNGIRCVGKYVYDKGLTTKTSLSIETLSGIKQLELQVKDGVVSTATVAMGRAVVEDDLVLDVDGRQLVGTPVSMGNPHVVFVVPNAEAVPLEELGPLVGRHEAFPGGVNVEFVQMLSKREMRMRVWERGSGITMACGTGSCASVAAATSRRLCEPGVPVTVHLDGGPLQVEVSDDFQVTMTGPATTVYEGEVAL